MKREPTIVQVTAVQPGKLSVTERAGDWGARYTVTLGEQAAAYWDTVRGGLASLSLSAAGAEIAGLGRRCALGSGCRAVGCPGCAAYAHSRGVL